MKRISIYAVLLLATGLCHAGERPTVAVPVSGTPMLHSTATAPDASSSSILRSGVRENKTVIERGPRIAQFDEPYYTILRRHTATLNDSTFSGVDFYLPSGAVGDTFAVYLKPTAPCSLAWIYEGWNDAGAVQAFLWEPNPEWLASYPTGRASLPDQARGLVSLSPLGEVIAGPNEAVSPGYGFSNLFSKHTLDSLRIYRSQAEGFLAGWVKMSEDKLPQPMADNVSGRGFCYTWFGGPWTTSDPDDGSIWGMYSSGLELDVILEAAVLYVTTGPPIIENLTQIPNTINGKKANNITVSIVDLLSDWSASDHAWLVWEVLEGGTTSLGMDSVEIFDDDQDLFFNGAIPNLGLNGKDVVHYWVTARNDVDDYATSIEYLKSFEIIPPPEGQFVLWIDEGAFGGYMYNDNWYYRDFSLMYALVGGFTTEGWVEDVVFLYVYYWEPDLNHGIDSDLINSREWTLIMYTGGGAQYMPMFASDDNPFADYIADEGTIFLASPDYFFDHLGEGNFPNEFSEGDFAYDVFGLTGGFSNPDHPDSVYTGTPGTLTDAFADESYEIYPNFWRHEGYGGNNTMDFIYPNTRIVNDLFVSPNDGNVYGVQYNRSGYRTGIFFSFDISQASVYSDDVNWNVAPTDQFIYLMSALWASSPEEDKPGKPVNFALLPNYPNPFNPDTRISFTVPRTGDVTLEVFNLLGQRVALLQQGVLAPGSYTRNFDGSGLASGTYLCRMSAPGYTQTRKLVLVK